MEARACGDGHLASHAFEDRSSIDEDSGAREVGRVVMCAEAPTRAWTTSYKLEATST